jgi:hypothetical protein
LVQHRPVTVQEVIADVGSILNKVNFVLNDHEQRLQIVEAQDFQQLKALQVFKSLCNSLGIYDMEQTQP